MKRGAVHVSELERRSVVSLERVHLQDAALADLASRRAIGFDVTNALADTAPYDVSQQWASRFVSERLDGVRYRTRFDTGQRAGGIAVFGAPGANPFGWPPPADTVPAVKFRRALERRCSLHVMEEYPTITSLPSAPSP
jgi:hypothetical protein